MSDSADRRSKRLDSWKAIAAYLDRDERTVQRWERQLGLPIGRVSGEPGRSVFAYTAEIDAWLKERQESPAPTAAVTLPSRRVRYGVAASGVLLALVGGGVLWWAAMAAGAQASRVEVRPDAIVGLDDAGVRVWEHPFPREERASPFYHRPNVFDVSPGRPPILFAAVALRGRLADEGPLGGQVFAFTPRGAQRLAFSFDETVRFGSASYAPPWAITDLRTTLTDAGRRVAVAAHHHTWWPSLVTILDDDGRRHGTFVHAGWIEYVRWLGGDRLVVAGYAQERTGGMAALLDARALGGEGPVASDGPFACTGCERGGALRYVVMPRSEVNRASGAPLNGARIQVIGDRLQVRTIEVPEAPGEGQRAAAADAIYEFTPSLDLVSTSFSSRYWEVHEALEALGKLDHTRGECADRDGPREVLLWEPTSGWRTVRRPV